MVGPSPFYQDFGGFIPLLINRTPLTHTVTGVRMPQRHSIDYDQMRPHSNSNAQAFYSSQRQQPRLNDAEQNAQAKRRMAAQRERDLRNYHQEQQYNRSTFIILSN